MRFNIAFFASLLLIIVSIVSIPQVVSVALTVILVVVIIASLGKDVPFLKPFLVSTNVIGTQSDEPTFMDKNPHISTPPSASQHG